jgi:glycosyltransferase involved in cell wall biosynthesis
VDPAVVQVVGPTDQWVLERLARRLVAKLPYARFVAWEPQRNAPPGLAYYVNYALYQGPTSFVDVGFFTHRDDGHAFLERARNMDHAVCMSKLYADWLREQGVETVTHIATGFDSYRYRPRLVLGVVGLLDHPRKGRHLVERVKALPFAEVRATEGVVDEGQLRDFYQSVDYVLIAATAEGGPLSLLEGLGMGKPVLAPEGVGMVPELPESPYVRRYPAGDAEALVRLLGECYEEKCRASRLVGERTWDRWAEAHHHLFRRLMRERGVRFPEPAAGFRFGMLGELEIPPAADASRLEEAVDRAAAQLYFGRYREARSTLAEAVGEFPFAGRLLESIPAS